MQERVAAIKDWLHFKLEIAAVTVAIAIAVTAAVICFALQKEEPTDD